MKDLMRKKQIIYTIFLFAFISSACKKNVNSVAAIDPYFSVVSDSWRRYMQSSNNGWANNDQGRFSWDDGYALEGLVSNFERSNDLRYVDTFLKTTNRIFAATDLVRGIRDKYRNMSISHGWSSTRYTADSSPHIFGVTDAMILYPVVRMFNIAKKIIPSTDARLIKIKQAVDFSIDEFNEIQVKDWVNIGLETGYFHDPYFRITGINTPVNQFARIGSLALELYLATDNPIYLDYVKKMARYLKEKLISKNEYFFWNYLFALNPSQIETPDDLSHSNLVVQFMILCYNNKVIFSIDEMEKLVKLYQKQLWVPDTGYREYLDGPALSTDVYIAHYYPLSVFDRQVYISLDRWFHNQAYVYDPSTFLNHFGNKLILQQAMNLYYK